LLEMCEVIGDMPIFINENSRSVVLKIHYLQSYLLTKW
jgi:hypothetical protein